MEKNSGLLSVFSTATVSKLLIYSAVCIILFTTSRTVYGIQPNVYWVDINKGDDSNPGTEEKPFKTIIKARDTIRHVKKTSGLPNGGIKVVIGLGDYEFIDRPLEFTSEDSGTEGSPIEYFGAFDTVNGVFAHLTAGKTIKWDQYVTPVEDPVMKSLLRDSENIVQVDLRKLGVTDFGDLGSGGLYDCANNKVDLFSKSDNLTMVLARYPNINAETGQWQWLSAGEIVDKNKAFKFNTNNTVSKRILSWKNTSTLWLHGYWSYDWADNYVQVAEILPNNYTFTASKSTPPVFGFVKNARYYALNILEELDAENEYYIDRGSGILYLYKSAAERLSTGNQGCVSVGENVITLNDVSFISFFLLTIDCSKSTAVVANNVNYATFNYVIMTDTGNSGISLVGYNNTMGLDGIGRTGCGAIYLNGGDQKTLTRGNNIISWSEVRNWSNWKRTYTPGIYWEGVGNKFTSNTIQNGPHSGMLGLGNDCLFEDNTFDTLCYETSDSGAFYSGRSWIDRGNIIRGNFFYNIINTEKTHLGAPSVQAIYLDDQMSGYTIENNRFINCHCGSFIGGGRRNVVRNNYYRNCSLCVHVDDRGLTWQKDRCSPGGSFEQELKSVNYQQPPWSTHYPELVNIMKDHPCVPVYNVIEDNKCCQSKEFIDASTSDLDKWMITVKNNTDKCQ